MITEQDIMENILHNDGLTRIMEACDSHLTAYPDITLDEMQRRANEFITEIFGDKL